jgi:hypothetical protein
MSSTPPTTYEFSRLVLDTDMTPYLHNAVVEDSAAASQIRHYQFVARTICRLEYELDQIRQEERTLFDHLFSHEDFQDAMRPVLRKYRRRIRRKGLHPYTHRPLGQSRPNSPPRLSVPTDYPIPPELPAPGPASSPSLFKDTVPKSPSNSSTNSLQFATAPNSSGSGSESDPIHITDDIADRPLDEDVEQVLSRHDLCTRCGLYGHFHDNCTNIPTDDPVETPPQRFQLCIRCGLPGHVKRDCDTNIRSFTVCPICEWYDRPQNVNCGHFDLSPVAARRIASRYNLPLDDIA